MDNYIRSRKQPPPLIKPRSPVASPRLLRSRSGGTSMLPEMHSSEIGSKFVSRSNSTTILRTYESSLNYPSTQKHKKSQKDRDRKTTVETTMQKKTHMSSPSAWALSPGRFLPPSSPGQGPKSLSPSPGPGPGQGSKNFKMDASAVRGVLKYFRQKKVSTVQQEEYHQFRIMHNRLLQWRFTNAKAESSIPTIKIVAQKKLFNVWLRISMMRKFVADKRMKMQQLKQEIKLISIVSSQGILLKEWAKIEAKNSEAVGRLARKLSAISLCLPLVDEAQADVMCVKDAIEKAEEIMGNIEELIMKMQREVEQSCYILTQLIPILKKEKVYIEELQKKTTMIISKEAEEESLRVHCIQQVWELRRGI